MLSTMRNFMSIDPGLDGTGFAVWSGKTADKLCLPLTSGLVLPTKDTKTLNVECRGAWLFQRLRMVAEGNRVRSIYVEWPNYRPTAAGSAVAASGDLGKLFFAASVASSVGYALGIAVAHVPVTDWKGNLPKDVVERRIRNRLGDDACVSAGFSSHVWDAVGIGLWVKGFFG